METLLKAYLKHTERTDVDFNHQNTMYQENGNHIIIVFDDDDREFGRGEIVVSLSELLVFLFERQA